MEGIVCFVDDIFIARKDVHDHLNKLRKVLDRLKENGIRINKDKCIFLADKVEY